MAFDVGRKRYRLEGIQGCKGLTPSGLLSRVGFMAQPFTDLLAQFYGFYGYTVSTSGIAIGAFWGLTEGFVHFGIFAWLYNLLVGRTKPI